MDSYRLIGPLLRRLPPEVAHRLTVRALAAGFARKKTVTPDDPALAVRAWGIDFPNPVGLAAGFDKDAEAFEAALGLGFGFVEVGSVTPRPQAGNPRPRLFRLLEDSAVINRLGFNSRGHGFVATRLRRRRRGSGIVGVNLGANHDSADPAGDYAVSAGIAPTLRLNARGAAPLAASGATAGSAAARPRTRAKFE